MRTVRRLADASERSFGFLVMGQSLRFLARVSMTGESFPHTNRKMRSTDNASARRNSARALDSKPDALKKTDAEWSLVRHREFAARQSGKAWNRNAVRRKNSTNDDIMVGLCK